MCQIWHFDHFQSIARKYNRGVNQFKIMDLKNSGLTWHSACQVKDIQTRPNQTLPQPKQHEQNPRHRPRHHQLLHGRP
jgi:hypothetical protein